MGEAEIDVVQKARLAAQASLAQVEDLDGLTAWYAAELGRGGQITMLARQVGSRPPEERPAFGASVNAAKVRLEGEYAKRQADLRAAALDQQLAAEGIDVSLPGAHMPEGRLHPSTRLLRRVYEIFADMGFQVYQSHDVETDEFNFELLNMPRHHPARDMQDTFYIDDDRLLRTHTSPGQIHAMRAYCPEPIRIILPGMCYRHEQITARSEIQFHQVEGLAVDRGITMADLYGTVESFARRMFGTTRPVRFRASYFPFTEPSAEVDVHCFLCDGQGCRLCKHTGWLEIMGCGMVHPTVLRNGGYDPDVFTGFAFGGGIERTAMQQRGITDIRHFWANDLRFLRQSR